MGEIIFSRIKDEQRHFLIREKIPMSGMYMFWVILQAPKLVPSMFLFWNTVDVQRTCLTYDPYVSHIAAVNHASPNTFTNLYTC